MICDHDKKCMVCQERYPHAIGYWDKLGIQGGCRDASIRRQLEDLESLEDHTRAALDRAEAISNTRNERHARAILADVDRQRDRMLGTDDL